MTLTHHHVCKLDFFSFFSSSIPNTILYYSIFIILFFQSFGIFSWISILSLTWDMIRLRFVSKLVPLFTDIFRQANRNYKEIHVQEGRKINHKPNEMGTHQPVSSVPSQQCMRRNARIWKLGIPIASQSHSLT